MKYIKYVLATVTFLLLLIRPVYSATLAVAIYGSYDYYSKALSVFWKTTTIYDSFKIDFYSTFVAPNAPCGTAPTLTLKSSYTSNYSNKNITLPNVTDGKYRVNIYGVVGTTSTLLQTQDFFIQAVSKDFTIGWCNTSSSTFTYTGTLVYTSTTGSFDFEGEENITTWQISELARNTQYFSIKNMLFVNLGYDNVSPTVTIKSPKSAQIITYTVIPEKPIWGGIIN
ncbi:hypothetical protein JZU46_00250 [bacterium]|nr:hypothetical protein [bacterium]